MIDQNDDWINSHLEMSPEKFHALGCVTVYWNYCEFSSQELLSVAFRMPWQQLRPMIHDLSSNQIWSRILFFVEGRVSPEMIEHIEHGRKFFDICRINRNTYVHAVLSGSNEWPPKGDVFVLKKQKGPIYDPKEIAEDLATVRRVADDLKNLRGYLDGLSLSLSWAFRESDPLNYKPLASLGKPTLPKSVL